ncbi:MAG: UbiA family prenyltransferase [Candidatus Aenigmatarchaeota archaeon]
MPKPKYFFDLILPEYFIITIFTVVAASLIIRGYLTYQLVLPILSVSLAMIGLNIMNNVIDIELDRINKPSRPLVKGFVSLKEAKIFFISSFILSILISFFIDFFASLFILLFIFLAYIYSAPPIQLKKYILSSNFIGSIEYGAIPFLITWRTVGGDLSLTFLLFFVLMIFVMAPIKDIEDIKGDKIKKIKTFPIIIGEKKTSNLVILSFFLIGLIMLLLEFGGIIDFKYIYATLLSFLLTGVLKLLYNRELKKIGGSEIVTQSKLVTYTMIIIVLVEISYGILNFIF